MKMDVSASFPSRARELVLKTVLGRQDRQVFSQLLSEK